jgi:PAS domain S-box-containing protein
MSARLDSENPTGTATELELRKRLAELSDFVENAAEGLHRVGPDGTILWANQAELNLLGYEAHEYVGRNIAEFHADRPTIDSMLGKLLKGDGLYDQPARLRCKDGTIKDVLIHSSALFEGDRFVHTRCFTRDVTHFKRAEKALRQSENRFRALMEQAPFSVQLLAPDGRTIGVNNAWSQLWGVTLEQVADYNILADPQLEAKGILPYIRRAFAGEAVRIPAIEYDPDVTLPGRTQHKDPGRWVSAVAYPLKDEAGEITEIVLIHTDITAEKRAEAALREADRRKDEFLATLAHELRNPLAPIRTSLQILDMPRLDEATARHSREVIGRQVRQLVRLVDDLLDVSRVMRGKITLRTERVELGTVVAQAVETAQPAIEAQGHRLSISLPDQPVTVRGDPVRLAQVFANLLTNAAKYTERGGHIALSAGSDADNAIVRVRDNGIGIAPDLLPKVFELFVQADTAATRSQGGLGIGLTLARNLVELHGGSIEARSEGLGKGSEFIVRLPSVTQRLTERARLGKPGPAPSASGHRLMVVDDNSDAADSLATLLRLQGHEVQVAYDGASALELAKSCCPSLVFLDLGMPGMDGYEVAREMRRMPGLEKTVLAALTGWGQEEDRRRAAEAGFHHHLVKPPESQDIQKLLAALDR